MNQEVRPGVFTGQLGWEALSLVQEPGARRFAPRETLRGQINSGEQVPGQVTRKCFQMSSEWTMRGSPLQGLRLVEFRLPHYFPTHTAFGRPGSVG